LLFGKLLYTLDFLLNRRVGGGNTQQRFPKQTLLRLFQECCERGLISSAKSRGKRHTLRATARLVGPLFHFQTWQAVLTKRDGVNASRLSQC